MALPGSPEWTRAGASAADRGSVLAGLDDLNREFDALALGMRVQLSFQPTAWASRPPEVLSRGALQRLTDLSGQLLDRERLVQERRGGDRQFVSGPGIPGIA